MFCAYPSIFDSVERDRSLAYSRHWRKVACIALAGATSFAVLISCSLAADFARTRDYDYDPPAPGSYTLPVIKLAADGNVVDSEGRALRLEELTHGRITVLSFIYTRCAAAKACPYATGVLNQLHQFSHEESSITKEMRPASMSFDPPNETPACL